MIDLDLFLLHKEHCHGKQFWQNWQNDLHLAGWRFGTVRNMAVTI